MPRAPKPPEYVAFTLRVPKDLLEAFDKALELGYFNARSRNEAIVKLIEDSLKDIFFVIEAFDKAKKLAKSPKYKNSNLPPELLHIQLAMEIITQTPSAEDITTKYQTLIGAMFAASKKRELSELKAKLNEIFNHSGDEEDG